MGTSSMAQLLKQNQQSTASTTSSKDYLAPTSVPNPETPLTVSNDLFPSLGSSVGSKMSSENTMAQRTPSINPVESNQSQDIKTPKPKGVWGSGKPRLNIKAKPFIPPGI